MISVTFASLISFALSAPAPASVPSGPVDPSKFVCFYTDFEYNLNELCYDTAEPQDIQPSWNDNVSSFRIKNGCIMTVFTDYGQGGIQRMFSGDVPFLDDNFNDQISSFRVDCNGSTQTSVSPPAAVEKALCVYSDVGFVSNEQCFDRVGYVVPAKGDAISSLKIKSGCFVTVFADFFLTGRQTSFNTDVSDIIATDNSFNDQISSMRITCDSTVAPPPASRTGPLACVYQHYDFNGDQRCYNDQGEFQAALNDDISSIEVRDDCTLTAYEHGPSEGESRDFRGQVPSVGDFNDRISVFKIACQ